MNPMLHALKNRKAADKQDVPQDHKTENVHKGGDHTTDLHAFVKALSPDQKDKLHAMLGQDKASNADAIAKGAPSKEEQGKIAQAAQQENAEEALEQNEGPHDQQVDSDQIAMGMLDSRFKNNAPSRPRNLHERVQSNISKDLKSKGKI
jgi:hypothetical protein